VLVRGPCKSIYRLSVIQLSSFMIMLLAHVHHAWDTYNRYGRTVAAAQRAIISSRLCLLFLYRGLAFIPLRIPSCL